MRGDMAHGALGVAPQPRGGFSRKRRVPRRGTAVAPLDAHARHHALIADGPRGGRQLPRCGVRVQAPLDRDHAASRERQSHARRAPARTAAHVSAASHPRAERRGATSAAARPERGGGIARGGRSRVESRRARAGIRDEWARSRPPAPGGWRRPVEGRRGPGERERPSRLVPRRAACHRRRARHTRDVAAIVLTPRCPGASRRPPPAPWSGASPLRRPAGTFRPSPRGESIRGAQRPCRLSIQ